MNYSGSLIFPLKFCNIRWLENAGVAQRAIDIHEDVKKFGEGVKKEKNLPKCKSFETVVAFVADPLLCPKLASFKSLASEVEPFLREFQSDTPLVPFLHTSLSLTMTNLMERFMTTDAIDSIRVLKDDDVQNKKNMLPAKEVILGFDTRKQLKKVTVKPADMLEFRQNCQSAMKQYVLKLLKRSPLTYPLTEAVTCLDPGVIAADVKLANKRLDKLLFILTDKNHISGSTGDIVSKEFRELTALPTVLEAVKSYSRSDKRVDNFWRDILKEKYKNFLMIVRLVCCLSHGNANVERGFSVNLECLFENMHEDSIVAKRQVYDAIQNQGGLATYVVPKALVLNARNAHARWLKAREDRQLKKTAEDQAASKAKEKRLKIKELEAQRLKLLETAKKEATALDEEIAAMKNN